MFIIFISLILVLSGCMAEKEPKEEKVYDYYAFYLNAESNELLKEGIDADELDRSISDEKKVSFFIDRLSHPKDTDNHYPVLNKNIKITDFKLKNKQLNLDFSYEYLSMPKDLEILVRATLVKTFTQIDDVEKITFTVKDSPLLDASENIVSAMDKNSFVENMGTDINAYKEETVSLYFADGEYKRLIKTEIKTRRRPNVPKEKMILDLLFKGPGSDLSGDLVSTIPGDLKLNSIITKNEVCYIDLSIKNVSSDTPISGLMTIYSIVNSLTEDSNIIKVKLSIDSNDAATYRGVKLDMAFEKDSTLLK